MPEPMTVPVALVALLRQCADEAAAVGEPLSEPQLDALCRALYPTVDALHAARDQAERGRDRVALADGAVCGYTVTAAQRYGALLPLLRAARDYRPGSLTVLHAEILRAKLAGLLEDLGDAR